MAKTSTKWTKENLISYYFQNIKNSNLKSTDKQRKIWIDAVYSKYKSTYPVKTVQCFIDSIDNSKNENQSIAKIQINGRQISFPIKNEEIKNAANTVTNIFSTITNILKKYNILKK